VEVPVNKRMSEPRNDRLTIRKTNEEVLRKRLEVQARDLCDTEIKSFVECAKYQGLLVVFNCRKENYTSKLLLLLCIRRRELMM